VNNAAHLYTFSDSCLLSPFIFSIRILATIYQQQYIRWIIHQVSTGTHSRLERTPAVDFKFEKRVPFQVKGKGIMQTYFVNEMTRTRGASDKSNMKQKLEEKALALTMAKAGSAFARGPDEGMGTPTQKRNQRRIRAQLGNNEDGVGEDILPTAQKTWMVFGLHTITGGTDVDQVNESMHVSLEFAKQTRFLTRSTVAYIVVQVSRLQVQ
jgi:hypothetical protein